MKKYMLLTAATIAVVSWILLTPGLTTLSAVNVTVKRAAVTRTATTVDCTGTLQTASQQTVVYGCPVMTEKIHVKAGDTVKKGQLLVQLDQKETAAAFATISATQSASSAESDDAQTDDSDTDTGDNSSSGDSDDADASAALQQYLNGQGGDADSLLSEYYGSSAASSSSGDADDSSQAVSLNVPDAVYADFSGMVTAVNATDGAFTQPTVPLVVVSDTNHMQVKAQVDESQISYIKVGQKAHISSSAFDDTFDGTVSQIAPTARTVFTGTTSTKTVVDVTIDIKAAASELKAGMNADTSILVSNANEISLPYEALQQDKQNRLYVMVVRKGKAVRQNVTTGTEHTDSIAIRSGVKVGDFVILNPSPTLGSGQKVHITSIG